MLSTRKYNQITKIYNNEPTDIQESIINALKYIINAPIVNEDDIIILELEFYMNYNITEQQLIEWYKEYAK